MSINNFILRTFYSTQTWYVEILTEAQGRAQSISLYMYTRRSIAYI